MAHRPIYVVLGINCAGERDVLGLWVGTGGEGAKHWMGVLSELRYRGVVDVCIVACDGVRSTLRYASKAHWSPITKALRTVYTAATIEAAAARFAEFEHDWDQHYPAIIRLWRTSWEQFIPFLAFPTGDQEDHLHHERR